MLAELRATAGQAKIFAAMFLVIPSWFLPALGCDTPVI
jgi:hypothetical protein